MSTFSPEEFYPPHTPLIHVNLIQNKGKEWLVEDCGFVCLYNSVSHKTEGLAIAVIQEWRKGLSKKYVLENLC